MDISKTLAMAVIASALLTNCGSKENDLAVNASASEKFCLSESFKSQIEFAKPEKKQVKERIALTGSVETNPDNVIHFVSLVSGIVSKTYYSLGDVVKKGQTLTEIRSTELSSLTAELNSLNSKIKVAETRLSSVKGMYDDEISSKKELIEAQADLDILKSEREKTNTNLSLYSASAEKGVFQIKAPSSGIITATSIASGSQISAESEPLFTISDLDKVWVQVNVYSSNITSILNGIDVDIKVLAYPNETFKGKIETISQVLDQDAKVLKARVVMKNDDFKLKPGMQVDVVANKLMPMEAMSIPTEALVFDQNQNYVVIYKNDCEIEVRAVETITSNNQETFIKTELDASEKLISKNQLLIYEAIKNF